MRDGEGRGGGVLVLVPGLVRLMAGTGTAKECMECDDVISRMYMYICTYSYVHGLYMILCNT